VAKEGEAYIENKNNIETDKIRKYFFIIPPFRTALILKR